MKRKDACYICGDKIQKVPKGLSQLEPKHRTRDHVPPQGLFDDPKPKNLITVNCCNQCNKKHSDFDEQFRVFCAIELNSNKTGKKIALSKVIGSTMKNRRQANFMLRLHQSMKPEHIETPEGYKWVVKSTFDADLIRAGIINIVKGLITHFYPEFDYGKQKFVVLDFSSATLAKGDAQKQILLMKTLEDGAMRETRGNFDEFQFWRQIDPTNRQGVWLLRFYEGVSFIVLHHSRLKGIRYLNIFHSIRTMISRIKSLRI